ncbi:MAG: intradiol ring-cleavage dioxygenase [Betaproteobacteria bacterium]|nr:intradiol ring-cleavage dioxygenase [Betaproteobacteria bacterium]MDH4326176.1 intradiol ring-cleavage dioxygenase [Betaproteobacteria bacterium]MDH5579490.1 intradiol ring-cleavage dioxygenase [Betaproteobacteria bacterium]
MKFHTRRRFLGAAAAFPFVGAAIGQDLPLTPECGPQSALTPRQTEGPYYTPNTPLRSSLVEPGSNGERLVLAGRVVSPRCRPVGKALLDFWHCDENGRYDNAGFRYRGHLFADDEGRFRLETIFPAIYPGRARHIHVKVQAPGRRILTTQLYFPGDARDGLWREELVVAMVSKREGRSAAFQFIVDA